MSCNLKVHEKCGKSFRHSNTVENHRKTIVLSCHGEQSVFIKLVSMCCIWHGKYVDIHTVKVIAAFMHAIKKE